MVKEVDINMGWPDLDLSPQKLSDVLNFKLDLVKVVKQLSKNIGLFLNEKL